MGDSFSFTMQNRGSMINIMQILPTRFFTLILFTCIFHPERLNYANSKLVANVIKGASAMHVNDIVWLDEMSLSSEQIAAIESRAKIANMNSKQLISTWVLEHV